jgi:hypothetical protein
LTNGRRARIFPAIMRITLELDPEVMRLLRYGIGQLEETNRRLSKMAAKERELSARVAAQAQGTKNAFEAIKGVMTTQGAALKEALDKLKSGNVDADDPEVIAALEAVESSLSGTNADMVAAAALANTPAAGDVPQPAADAAANNPTQ